MAVDLESNLGGQPVELDLVVEEMRSLVLPSGFALRLMRSTMWRGRTRNRSVWRWSVLVMELALIAAWMLAVKLETARSRSRQELMAG